QVGLAGRDPDGRERGAVLVEHWTAARAAAGVGRLAGKRRTAGPVAEHARDRPGPRQGGVEHRVSLHVDAAAAVAVLDSVERRVRRVLHAGRKVDAADEAD